MATGLSEEEKKSRRKRSITVAPTLIPRAYRPSRPSEHKRRRLGRRLTRLGAGRPTRPL